jgi:hypothetical protein
MPRTMKIGGMDVIIPDDSPLASAPADESTPRFQAEKPDEPEKLESQPYVYRPNDPFQSSVDRVVALGNVQEAKPWVKKAFLIMFLIFPGSLMETTAVNALIFEPPGEKLRKFIMYNVIGLIACAPYLLIWIGTSMARKKACSAASLRAG